MTTSPRSSTNKSSAGRSPDLGLDPGCVEHSVQHLGRLLADQHVLYQKTRQVHWNLEGQRFSPLHRLFEEQYEALAADIDETAERIRTLGSPAPGSMCGFAKAATLEELEPRLFGGDEALSLLQADHDALVRTLREAIDDVDADAGTADFLTALLRAHEKTAWILRSHRAPA